MAEAPRRIAITGASGYIGTRLIEHLRRDPSIERILALDLRPIPSSEKVVSLIRDVSQPLGNLFAQHSIQGVIHLAFILRPGCNREAIRKINVGGTANVLRACAEGGVEHVVYLSSTTIYGAHPDNPPLLTEESPVRPNKGFQYAEDKAKAEELLAQFAKENPDTGISVLRGCVVMGPKADNFITQTFKRPLLVSVKGYDPPMQFLHEDDLVDIIALCLSRRVRDTYNIGGEGAVPWSEMMRLSGKRCLSLPAPLLYGLTEATWRLHLQNDSPSSGLNMIRYPWVASTEKIGEELGIRLHYSSKEALVAFLKA